MDGTFELLGPSELLQLLAQARQTGAFKVPGGEIYLEQGQSGKDGLFQILALREGEFRLLVGERAKQSSLQGSLELPARGHSLYGCKARPKPLRLVQLTDANRITHLTLSYRFRLNPSPLTASCGKGFKVLDGRPRS